MWPLKRLRLRLRTRSSVREFRGWMEPPRSRPSRTRRETRFLRQETPSQVHGSVLEFHVVSFLYVSEEFLNDIRGWRSGFWFWEA